jgi:hypothetical protein
MDTQTKKCILLLYYALRLQSVFKDDMVFEQVNAKYLSGL